MKTSVICGSSLHLSKLLKFETIGLSGQQEIMLSLMNQNSTRKKLLKISLCCRV